ncbi:uncharacterized protein M421DRAFT_415316 [Didymella exigua CBS 183.55]|uniref:Secreted protein n=1 Tax=Didymella exigua CBS 183.55 TaxID=1150837 RepID=A0A6A5S4K7_9PLEO|nr:uncharacterized protein M421DRAFT_415316 [Didymella exigua CBS 183.55]KAF1934278.1 hypothetical protein M421DRAFT_415316 [Didymella exigua CBS 183.55]
MHTIVALVFPAMALLLTGPLQMIMQHIFRTLLHEPQILGGMIKHRQPPTSRGLCGITCAPQLDMMPARRIAPTASSPRLSPPSTRFLEGSQPLKGR